MHTNLYQIFADITLNQLVVPFNYQYTVSSNILAGKRVAGYLFPENLGV